MALVLINVLLVFYFINVGQAMLNKPEGSECIVNGHNGTCINYQKCLTLAVDLHYDYKNIEVVLCSFDGDLPIICCTSCDVTSNVTNLAFSPTGKMRFKTNQMSKEKCHTYSDAAFESNRCVYYYESWSSFWYEKNQCNELWWSIVKTAGGQRARRNQFPHMALLGYGETLDSAEWLCGGSLISDRYILTAGHCTAHAKLRGVKYVALGILRRSDPPWWWHKYYVKNIVPHPDYRSPNVYNDIALLELRTRVKFRPNVFPACLPYPNAEEEFGRQSVTATGWGALGSYTLEGAETLQVIEIEEFTEEECQQRYKEKRHMKLGYNHTIQMCYGDHIKAVDTCPGDSGGPLQVHSKLCMYVVLGVTSSGTTCGINGGAGLYTRVRHYLPWIESIVWAEEEPTKTDIWRELILKKLENKRRSSTAAVINVSMKPDVAEMRPDTTEISMRSAIIHPDVITTSTESDATTSRSKKNLIKTTTNIKDQNDWIVFLNRHLNETILKKNNEWIGTDKPEFVSISNKVTTSSVTNDDDYLTPDTTDSDSYDFKSRDNDKTNDLRKNYESDKDLVAEVTYDDENLLHSSEYSPPIPSSSTKITSRPRKISTAPGETSSDSDDISTTIVMIEKSAKNILYSASECIHWKSKNVGLFVLTFCALFRLDFYLF